MQEHIFDGEMLLELRERANMTIGYLADKTGLSPQTLEKLELGETTNPHLNTVKRLADALKVPGAMFYTLPNFSNHNSSNSIRHLKMVIEDLRHPQRLSGLKEIRNDLSMVIRDIDEMLADSQRTSRYYR